MNAYTESPVRLMLYSREARRIIRSCGGAKPTFEYVVQQTMKNITGSTCKGVSRRMVALQTIGMMVAAGEVAVDDDGRLYSL